jgi:sialidase-1
MSQEPEIVTAAEATEQHPRHSCGDIIELNDGSLFMSKMEIFKSGSLRHAADDEAKSDIVGLVSRDGGRTWGGHRTMVKCGANDHAAYYPGLLRLRNGDILFRHATFHRFVYQEPWKLSGYVCRSQDECRTFSNPVTLLNNQSELAWSVGDMRQLSTGRVIIPTQKVVGYEHQDEGEDHSLNGIMYSDDNGLTWKVCDVFVDLPMRGAMEPKIEELKDGRLLMVMRTELGSVFKSYSGDGGCTWSKAQTTGLRAPESCPGLRRIPQTSDLVLIWNHSLYDPWFDHSGLRTPLSVAISKDEGDTWERIKDIETDPQWEFTNPITCVTGEGKLLIAYEASKYESLTGPGHGNVGQTGRVGRSRMPLKLAIVDLGWLYE